MDDIKRSSGFRTQIFMVSRKKQKAKMVFRTRHHSDVYEHHVYTALMIAKRDYGLNLYKKQQMLMSFKLNLPVSI